MGRMLRYTCAKVGEGRRPSDKGREGRRRPETVGQMARRSEKAGDRRTRGNALSWTVMEGQGVPMRAVVDLRVAPRAMPVPCWYIEEIGFGRVHSAVCRRQQRLV